MRYGHLTKSKVHLLDAGDCFRRLPIEPTTNATCPIAVEILVKVALV